MPGSTPKYAFPYPLGTDPISDGDDQIKALAERVETVIGTGRAWFAVRGTDVAMPPVNTFGQAVTVPTTAPVGSLLAVVARLELSAPSACNLVGRINTPGVTDPAPARDYTVYVPAGQIGFVIVLGLLTVTTANPTVTIDAGQAGAAGGTLRSATNLLVVKVQ